MKIQMKILNKEFYHCNTECAGGCDSGYVNLPSYVTLGSAGIDLVLTEDLTLYPGETKLVGTGLAIWIGSSGYWYGVRQISVAGLLLPRSGLGSKGLILANSVGLLDEDYQGELKVSCWNRLKPNKQIVGFQTTFGRQLDIGKSEGVYLEQHETIVPIEDDVNAIKLKAGERFAQLIFIPIIKAEFDIVDEFSNETDRGQGGFGSTDHD